jgi:multiple sugar transport system substrate-binding protein
MHARRKILTILSIIISATLVLTACQQQPQVEVQSDKPFEGEVIDFWMIDDPQVTAIRDLLPKFKEETGIEVNITEYPLDTIFEKQMLSLKGNTGKPDLVGFDLWFVPAFGETGTLEDLTPYIEKLKADSDYNFDDILPTHVEGYKYQDQQIGLGFIPVQMLMVYRIDLFENAEYKAEFQEKFGHELRPPETMEEFLQVVEFFTRDTDGDGEIDLWGTATQMERDDPIMCAFSHFMYPYGGDSVDENTRQVVFNSPENLQALQDFVKVVTTYSPPGTLGYHWGDMQAAMQRGQVAIQLNWNVFMGEYEDPEKSLVAGKLGYGPTPGAKVRRSLLGGWGLGMNKSSQNKEAAFEFIKWVLRQDIDKEIAMNGGAAPMRMSNYHDPEVKARFPHGEASLETARYSTPPPRIPEFPEIMETMGLALSEAANGIRTPEEALATGAERMQEILEGK